MDEARPDDDALSCGAIGVVHVLLALPLGPSSALVGLFLLGVSCGVFNASVTRTLQLRTRDDMRGRVMAMYPIGILGSGLVGAPLATKTATFSDVSAGVALRF